MSGGWLFCVLGLAAAGAAWAAEGLGWRLFLACQAWCWLGLGWVYGRRSPRYFLKKADGRLGWQSWLWFWPYYLYNHFLLALWRWLSGEAAAHEIVPGLFLGRRLGRGEAALVNRLGIRAVLDFTCEYEEPRCLREGRAYLCLPTLDMTPPKPQDLQAAVKFIRRQRARGPIYVHCALGHGRSAVAVMAWLLAEGQVADAEAAEHWVRARRPGARLNGAQKAALRQWERALLSLGHERGMA